MYWTIFEQPGTVPVLQIAIPRSCRIATLPPVKVRVEVHRLALSLHHMCPTRNHRIAQSPVTHGQVTHLSVCAMETGTLGHSRLKASIEICPL